MAIQIAGFSGTLAEIEAASKGQRSVNVPRGIPFCTAGTTGTIAAALAAGSAVFSMRLDAAAGTKRVYVERVRLQWTTLVAFTTPLTAGRRLELWRGTTVSQPSGGAALNAMRKSSVSDPSEVETAQGGDLRISTTAALTMTGVTWEAGPMSVMSLSHVGAAGNYAESVFEFHATESAPIILQPEQVLAVRNPVVMDAAGTWQLAVRVDWHEADNL